MESLRKYVTADYMARLATARLNVAAKTSAGSGARKSNAKGNSLEFSDFRDYAPGDDIRRVDWNGYGRLNKLFVKVFADERQATVNIFIDKSKSMACGGHKYNFARLAAVTLAYLALNNADRTEIICCDASVVARSGRVEGKLYFNRLVDFLDAIEPGGETALGDAVEYAIKNGRLNGGVSFLISDFFSDGGYERPVKLLRAKGQKVALIHVLDKSETDLDFSGATRLTDCETGDFKDALITRDVINAYNAALDGFKRSIMEFCQKHGASYLFARADENALKALAPFYTSN